IRDDLVTGVQTCALPISDEYIFKHNKEREAIQKRTSSAAARRYHQVIADWLDHQGAVRTSEEYIAMLARHREQAGDHLRAGLARSEEHTSELQSPDHIVG